MNKILLTALTAFVPFFLFGSPKQLDCIDDDIVSQINYLKETSIKYSINHEAQIKKIQEAGWNRKIIVVFDTNALENSSSGIAEMQTLNNGGHSKSPKRESEISSTPSVITFSYRDIGSSSIIRLNVDRKSLNALSFSGERQLSKYKCSISDIDTTENQI